jgi:hypothetical protein
MTTPGDDPFLTHAPHIGRFHNPTPKVGWSLEFLHNERRWAWCWPYTVPIYEFNLNPLHPLTYEDAKGGLWQPDRHAYRTDAGSIPPPVSWFASYHPLMYPRSYSAFHDSACGETIDDPAHPGTIQHGLWYCAPGETEFRFRRLTWQEANRLCLVDMLQVEGASLRQANSECWAVDTFGPRW